jgi:hypothetical protein
MDVCQECLDTSQSFDSVGIPFVIDNCAICIICNDRSQFVGPLRVQHTSVETTHVQPVRRMLVQLLFISRRMQGKRSKYHVPNAIYDPNLPLNILGIPFLGDHFGAKDTVPTRGDDGSYVRSSASKTTFMWDHGQHSRDFTHDAQSLPVLTLDIGVGYFQALCTRVRRQYEDTIHFAFSSAHSILTDEPTTPLRSRMDVAPVTPDTDFTLGQDVLYTDGTGSQSRMVYKGATPDGLWYTLHRVDGSKVVTPQSHVRFLEQPDFSIIPSTPLDYRNEVGIGISKEEAQELAYPRILSPSQQKLLSWHHRLYHLPFARLFQLAQWKILPRSILGSEANPPLCVACQFGQAHCRPWRSKNKASGSIRRASETQPGDGTSVNQIVSAQPGLIPQMAGFLASDRIWGTTNFCDHASNFVYVQLMRNFTLEETLLANRAYEKVLKQAGRTALHYHADNGRFTDKGFHKDINDKGQEITFCGVGAHHQNGIIENRNKQLTLGARTLLMHGMRHWPQMVDSLFWPFAMKAMAE